MKRFLDVLSLFLKQILRYMSEENMTEKREKILSDYIVQMVSNTLISFAHIIILKISHFLTEVKDGFFK